MSRGKLLSPQAGVFTVLEPGHFTLSETSEFLDVIAGAGIAGIDITGNSNNNVISGNEFANILDGGAGADRLNGGAGDDVLVVDNVGDTFLGGIGIDTVVVNAGALGGSAGAFSYSIAASLDVENLTLDLSIPVDPNSSIDLVGNVLGNHLTGHGGTDYFFGGGGADFFEGRGGSDNYIVDSFDDTVIETAGNGVQDRVLVDQDLLSSFTLAEGADVEILSGTFFTTNAALNLTGNSLNQTIYGTDGANSLNGGGGRDTLNGFLGNDRLDGGAGADVLQGYAGADTFVFSTTLVGAQFDRINDFNASTGDKFELHRSAFVGIGAAGTLADEAFATGSAASEADDRVIYDTVAKTLSYDRDGSGSGSAIVFAKLMQGGIVDVHASDFVIV